MAVLLAVTIWQFGRRQVISRSWRKWFNVIILGLSIGLGLSIQNGFRGMALDLRWRILSLRKRSVSEVDKILRSDSPMVVAELIRNCLTRNPFKRWKMIFTCTVWLMINLVCS